MIVIAPLGSLGPILALANYWRSKLEDVCLVLQKQKIIGGSRVSIVSSANTNSIMDLGLVLNALSTRQQRHPLKGIPHP